MKYNEVEDLKSLEISTKVDEGKTKAIYNVNLVGLLGSLKAYCNIEDAVAMVFKDDITAGDGVKHDIIEGKAILDWKTNRDIYEYLNKKGIRTHYLCSPKEKISIVKKLDRKINLEVVTRRIATGSILKHTACKEGQMFLPVLTQFFYKDDFLHDPLLDSSFIQHITDNKNFYMFNEMRAENAGVFCALEGAFAKFKIQLVDIKLEYGIVDGKLTLIDEITGGSFRLWPYADGIEFITCGGGNCLSGYNPKGRLDKDLYRKGEASLEGIRDKFQEVANITSQFKDLDIAY
jgi:phosphoribosylaminoimidazole-succinocarboxamide synthase